MRCASPSAAIALGWVAAQPIDRPEEPAIAYLDAHAQHGDSAVVVLGAANVIRDAHLSAPYPYLWSVPARVRDADLGTLEGLLAGDRRPTWVLVANRSVDDWDLDFSTAQSLLDARYERVASAGKFTIYRLTRV